MLTKEQQSQLQSTLQNLGPQYQQALSQFMQPKGYEDYKGMFEEQYVKPAQQAYERSVLPSIQQRFVDTDAGSSSALNQALAQSASDLSTSLGTQFGQFMQGQQQNQLQAMGQYNPLMTNQTFSPMLQEREGILGKLIEALGRVGGGAMAASSRDVKENIVDYHKGFSVLDKLSVKNYDYKSDIPSEKNKVGIIAEDLPEELQVNINGILGVDLYGLLSVAINAIKELKTEITNLKGELCQAQ
jgi:hypothetical protein